MHASRSGNSSPLRSSSTCHPASVYLPVQTCVCVSFTHPACLTGCVAFGPGGNSGSPACRFLKPASRCLTYTVLHCHLHSLTHSHTPQSLTLCTHTLHPHAHITGLTHHECPAAPHNLSPPHTHSHSHSSRASVNLWDDLVPPPTLPHPPLVLPPPSPWPRALHYTCRELYCTTVCCSLVASYDGLRPHRDGQRSPENAGDLLQHHGQAGHPR